MRVLSPPWQQLSFEEKTKYLRSIVDYTELYVLIYNEVPDALPDALYNFSDKIRELGLYPLIVDDLEAFSQITMRMSHKIVFVISDFNLGSEAGFSFRQKVFEINQDLPFISLFTKEKGKNISNVIERLRAECPEVDPDMFLPSAFIDVESVEEVWQEFLEINLESRLESMGLDAKNRKTFIEVARNLMEECEGKILNLENATAKTEILNSIAGTVHTLKGGSSFFQPRTLGHYFENLEEYLSAFKRGKIELNGNEISILLKWIDFGKSLLNEYMTDNHQYYSNEFWENFTEEKSDSPGANGLNDQKPSPLIRLEEDKVAEKLMKVPVSLLDRLLQMSGEQIVVRNIINKLNKNIKARHQDDSEYLEMVSHIEELNKINTQIQSCIYDLRKIPAKEVLAPLRRLVRDTCVQLNKSIQLEIFDRGLRIDTSLGEIINQSLIHLIRNAIDHGIEAPLEREKLGKGPEGLLRIEISEDDENISVILRDDGKGLQTESIKRKAIEQGLLLEELAQRMKEMDIWQFVFHPGFTTKENVSSISGRGIGMNVVKEQVEKTGGSIIIESTKGLGTVITMVLPIPKSVFITRCLFVKVELETYGILIQNIYRILHLKNEDNQFIKEVGRTLHFQYGEDLVPLVTLKGLNEGKPLTYEELGHYRTLVILKSNRSKKLLGLCVDAVYELEDTVVQSFSDYFLNISSQYSSMGSFYGTTYLADGTAGLILDADGLMAALAQ